MLNLTPIRLTADARFKLSPHGGTEQMTTGVAMGTVDRGLLWFDADRAHPLGRPHPRRYAKSARHGLSKNGTGPPPRHPDEPRDPAHRGATT